MKAIHKFVLPMMEEATINAPEYFRVFNAEMQDGFICVWAIVDTDSPIEKKRFNMYKTGQEINADPGRLVYIGTAKVHVGMELGFHIFEVLNIEP